MATRVAHPDRTALNWLFVGGSLVTLFIWASIEDPFNAPKSWILYSVAFWLLGWVGFQVKARWQSALDRSVLLFSGAFSLTLLLAFFFTDVKLQGIFGDYARRTGFLSYFSLVVFFVGASFLVTLSNVDLFDRVTLVVGFIVGFYGFLQHYKIDAIKWNNPYNSVLSTLGNPDFAAAVMAIFMVLAFGLVVNSTKSAFVRLFAAVNVLLLLVTIVFSQVRQGLLAGAIGVGLVVVVWVYQRQKIAAWVLVGLGVVGGLAGLVGMLNQGPLKGFFYKASVTYRGDYWRAGVRMFKDHPWFGVGLDRYGAYFRQYRDATQALRRGPDIVSNAAHDVPIQLAATGGIFVLIGFLALTGFILWRGVVALRNTAGVTQIVVATFFGAWITYEAQSLISIDNVGIAIWGWLLGGIVVALSKDSVIEVVEEKLASNLSPKTKAKMAKKKTSTGTVSLAQPLVSGLLFVVALALVIPMFLADSSLKNARNFAPPTGSGVQAQQQRQAYLQIVRKPLGYGFQDAHVKVTVGTFEAEANQIPEGKANLVAVLSSDPRSYEAANTLALIDEAIKNFSEASSYRRKIATLDPWNYKNLLQLGQDLKASGDTAGAKAIVGQIDAFASKTVEASTAHKDFGA
jgi:O-antigen ligase